MRQSYRRFSRKSYATRANDLADELAHWHDIYVTESRANWENAELRRRAEAAADRAMELQRIIIHLRTAASSLYALD